MQEKAGEPLIRYALFQLSESEPTDDASKGSTMISEPGAEPFPGISLARLSRSWLGGVRRRGGKNVVGAFVCKHVNQS